MEQTKSSSAVEETKIGEETEVSRTNVDKEMLLSSVTMVQNTQGGASSYIVRDKDDVHRILDDARVMAG